MPVLSKELMGGCRIRMVGVSGEPWWCVRKNVVFSLTRRESNKVYRELDDQNTRKAIHTGKPQDANPDAEQLDKLAEEKHHDRSSEINNACRAWIEAGGKDYLDMTTLAKIEELEASVRTALEELRSFTEIYQKTVERQDHTIKRLLDTLPNANK